MTQPGFASPEEKSDSGGIKNGVVSGSRATEDAVLVLRIRQVEQINSTFETVIREVADELRETGSHLILEGVRPGVMATLEKTGTIDEIGRENVIPAGEALTEGLDLAWSRAFELAGADRSKS